MLKDVISCYFSAFLSHKQPHATRFLAPKHLAPPIPSQVSAGTAIYIRVRAHEGLHKPPSRPHERKAERHKNTSAGRMP